MAQEQPEDGLPDSLSNLPKNPPIYKNAGFDPSPLERAAELGKQTKTQLWTMLKADREKQLEMKEEKEEARRQAGNLPQQAKQAEKEARKQLEQQRAQARENIEKHKQSLKDSAEKDMQVMKEQLNARLEEQKQGLVKEQDKIHAETLSLESRLKEEIDLEVIKRSTEGSILSERSNHSQRLDMLKTKAAERRDTIMSGITVAATTLGAGLADFLEDSERRSAFVVAISTAVLGIYTAKVTTGVAGRFLEARLGKPSLVRETSRASGTAVVTQPLRKAAGQMGVPEWAGGLPPATSDVLDGVILDKPVEARLRSVAGSTANTKRNRAPFRHLLLYGPPGTGKTLFAKGLARHSGLEYAILTGGDVAPLGRDAVTEIHKVFDWAETSKQGVLLFIDESDAFLRKRSTETLSEDLRNALNAFLYRTGSASDKFMVVYASNQPEQFDWAINDRIDEMVEFKLPSEQERLRMVAHYMHTLLEAPSEASPIVLAEDVDQALVRSVVSKLEGFSGREIHKLAVAWQAAAYGRSDATLDEALLLEVLEIQLEQKRLKQHWAAMENATYAAITDTPVSAAPAAQDSSSEGAPSSPDLQK